MTSAPQNIPADRKEKIRQWFIANRPTCPIAMSDGFYAHGQDLHHARMPNTKTNRKLYPLVIHSMLNLMYVNHDYHLQNGRFGQRKGYLWAEKAQAFLEKNSHKNIRAFVNGMKRAVAK